MKSILLLASTNNLVTEYLKRPLEKSYLSRDSTYQNVFMMLPFDSVCRVVSTLIASDVDPKIEITNEPFSHSFIHRVFRDRHDHYSESGKQQRQVCMPLSYHRGSHPPNTICFEYFNWKEKVRAGP